MKNLLFSLILLLNFGAISTLLSQTENDYIYFKNFVRHVTGEICEHIPPATSYTAYLNGDESRVLIENSPRWSSGTEPNIPGNGTFGVELGMS